ncbi:hypothetical protein GCM10009817_12540 [Terrabacter lapilli]|uniref:Uncharacterized protein n=1 Tax=Terrabacter lapilli TaxID=436231 RepID=A0ABN2RS01_9MICO
MAAHAHLSTGAFSGRVVPAGPNREIYYPTHPNGDTSAPAMDIAVPIVEAPED